ncbi:MAG: hypothetical protein U0903_10115 [Planctomycetales bacterium]
MSTPAPENPAAAPAPRKRSAWKKIVGWGVLLVLVGGVLLEGGALYQYQTSLSNLDAAIDKSRQPGKPVGVPLNEIGKHLSGFAIRDDVQGGSAAKASRRRKVVYRWPSLVTQFRLVATVDDKDNVIGVEGAYGGEQIAKTTAPPVVLPEAKPEPPPKPVGFKQAPEQAVVLAMDDLKVKGSLRRVRCGSLAREFFRQAVLIAARDELGAETVDAALSEVTLLTDSPQGFPLRIDVLAEPDPKSFGQARFIVKMFREDATGNKFEWTSSPQSIALLPTPEMLAEKAEALSRGDLINGLKDGGYQKAKSTGEPVSAPAGCEKRMDLLSQYARLRQLHSERRLKGETAENLGALIRVYANLGELTEPHWTPMSKALRARAILYANRMIARYGKTPVTLAHRAYAWALAGNHGLALVDLKAVEEAKVKDLPDWFPLIVAFCEYRPQILGGYAGENEQLALFLRMRVLDPIRDTDRAMEAIDEMLKVNPICWRAVERMCETESLGPCRQSTEGVADESWLPLYARLKDLPGLPAAALKIAASREDKKEKPDEDEDGEVRVRRRGDGQEHATRVALIQELCNTQVTDEAGAEPSWRVLGEMLNDANFVQAWRVLYSLKFKLGISAEDMPEVVKQIMPQVAEHRFKKFLLSFGNGDNKTAAAGLLEIYRNQPGEAYEIQCLPVANVASLADYNYYVPLCSHIDNHWERLQGDLWRVDGTQFREWAEEASKLMIDVAPNQPGSLAYRLQRWTVLDDKVAADWEKKYGEDAYLMKELGRKYQRWAGRRMRSAAREVDQPLPHAQRILGVGDGVLQPGGSRCQPGRAGSGDKTTGARSRTKPGIRTPGLPADAQGAVGRRAGAAEEAAGSYSGSSLTTAARAAEGMKDWKTAEDYYRSPRKPLRHRAMSGTNGASGPDGET